MAGRIAVIIDWITVMIPVNLAILRFITKSTKNRNHRNAQANQLNAIHVSNTLAELFRPKTPAGMAKKGTTNENHPTAAPLTPVN